MNILPEKVIDFHAHILPGLDDGPGDCRTAAQMLVRLYEQGVTHVVSTSHFYRHEESTGSFLRRRERAAAELMSYIESENITHIPKIILGAEVYFSTALTEDPNLERLCIEGTDYILIELPYCVLNRNVCDSFMSLASCGRVKPILAHIERYASYGGESTIFELLQTVPGQINCDSVISPSAGRLITKLVRSGAIIAIGSDAHNMTSRAPHFAEARKKFSRKLGAAAFAELMESSDAILENKEI